MNKLIIKSLLLLILSSQLFCFCNDSPFKEPFVEEEYYDQPASELFLLGFIVAVPFAIPIAILSKVPEAAKFCRSAVNFPFYVVKKSIYDFPKALSRKLFIKKENNNEVN